MLVLPLELLVEGSIVCHQMQALLLVHYSKMLSIVCPAICLSRTTIHVIKGELEEKLLGARGGWSQLITHDLLLL